MDITGPIILVDDDEDDHNIFTDVCTGLGVENNKLQFFYNGLEFLNFLRATNVVPFVIFCDINMPGVDGLSLRAKINEDEKLRRQSIPFIFFSTAATESQIEKAYDLTVQGFFIKGVSFEETKRMIKHILVYWAECKHPNTHKKSR